MLDGATNGALYALLALATVLVFAITRVILIPQGEFVTYGALTLAMIQNGNAIGSMWKDWGDVPGTAWLLLVLALVVAAMDVVRDARRALPSRTLAIGALRTLAVPLFVFAIT